MALKKLWAERGMKERDRKRAAEIEKKLREFSESTCQLPGALKRDTMEPLVRQIIDSIRRVEYVKVIASIPQSQGRKDPNNELFDPVRAALLYRQEGELEEASWLVFLYVHFSKHVRTKWRLAKDVYGQLGTGGIWTWPKVYAAPGRFSKWMADNYETLAGGDGVKRMFGNHRKYESIRPTAKRSTGDVVQSYVEWVGKYGSHGNLFDAALAASDGDGQKAFGALYRSIDKVMGFGRTARFDYLTMIGKLEIAPIEPDSPYLKGATGPLDGARLLFGGRKDADLKAGDLEEMTLALGKSLGVNMQVMEDSLCNWQKSPTKYLLFRG